jgi:hypothetical protein
VIAIAGNKHQDEMQEFWASFIVGGWQGALCQAQTPSVNPAAKARWIPVRNTTEEGSKQWQGGVIVAAGEKCLG